MANVVTVDNSVLPFKLFNTDVGFLQQVNLVRDTNADLQLLAAVAGKYAGIFGAQYGIGTDHDLSLKSNTTEKAFYGAIRGLNVRIGYPIFTTKLGEALKVAFTQNITNATFYVAYFTYLSGR